MEKINKNISVTIVCPGPVETNFLAESFTEKSGEVCLNFIFMYILYIYIYNSLYILHKYIIL